MKEGKFHAIKIPSRSAALCISGAGPKLPVQAVADRYGSTSKKYARQNGGKCAHCVHPSSETSNTPTREQRILDHGYQAYAREEGHTERKPCRLQTNGYYFQGARAQDGKVVDMWAPYPKACQLQFNENGTVTFYPGTDRSWTLEFIDEVSR